MDAVVVVVGGHKIDERADHSRTQYIHTWNYTFELIRDGNTNITWTKNF